jgi:mono/diheme cytochrome c family protein
MRQRLRLIAGTGIRNAMRVTVGDLLRWTLRIVVVVIVLGAIVAWGLVHYPDTQIPKPEPLAETRYLDQGWGTARDSPQRETYYYTPQGTSVKNLRYSWFVNLERPWGRRRFADPEYLQGLGFIVDPAPTKANPDRLPVGFARHYDDTLNEDVLDITCSACHTGQINITRGGRTTGIRIDGGAAMHAFTAVRIGHFAPVLLGSMTSTYVNPFKFDRFARKVLGEEAYEREGTHRLRQEFRKVLRDLMAQAGTERWRDLYPTEEGFGRTDALARIANTVFADKIDPANYRIGNAPVSYPYLWNIWKFDWVQYTASVSQPMARNVGEAMGVGAAVHFMDPYGRPIGAAERYRTSVRLDDVQRIETTLQALRPPRWPEDLLGAIDRAKAARGRVLFDRHCQGCHGPHVAVDAIKKRDAPLKTSAEPLWLIEAKDIRDIGTDPQSALNFSTNELDLSNAGLDPQTVRALLRKQLVEYQRRSAAAIPELEAEVQRLERQGAAGKDLLLRTEEALADAKQSFDRYLTDERIQQSLDRLDLRRVTSGVGLNILGLVIRDRYYTERAFSPEMRDCFEGFGMLDIPQVLQGYKPRPLEGVWATPPFLHNGSVPNLYELLSPAYERSRTFVVGRREFDPRKVGYVTEGLSKSGFVFDTRLPGNMNTGHEFRAGYVPFDEQRPELIQFGVIGPELTPDERWEIIEYLKIHSDEPAAAQPQSGPAPRMAASCRPGPPAAQGASQ